MRSINFGHVKYQIALAQIVVHHKVVVQGQEHVLAVLHFDREKRVGRRGFDVLHGAEFEGRHTVFARFVATFGRFGQSLTIDNEEAEPREGAERRNRVFVLGRAGIEGVVDRVSPRVRAQRCRCRYRRA